MEHSQYKHANEAFYEKAKKALNVLFEKAKSANEVHFAMALMPEMRGCQDEGWSTAQDAQHAYNEYFDLIEKLPNGSAIKIRVMLAFYNHLAEGSGFYEIPKKLLLTAGGNGNNMYPFQRLVSRHKRTGNIIAPNANKIMADMIGHAAELEMNDLTEVIRDAFDPDIRNAVAHADYIIWNDGLRLRRRNGGHSRLIPWDEFTNIMERGINFFGMIRDMTIQYVHSYNPPKTIRGKMDLNQPEFTFTIKYDPETGGFGFSCTL